MAEKKKMNDLDLMNVAGGVGTAGELKWKWVMSDPGEGYLALRSDPSVSADNEVARLVSGTAFQIQPDNTNGEYVYAYFNGMNGWVDFNKIKGFEMHGTAY